MSSKLSERGREERIFTRTEVSCPTSCDYIDSKSAGNKIFASWANRAGKQKDNSETQKAVEKGFRLDVSEQVQIFLHRTKSIRRIKHFHRREFLESSTCLGLGARRTLVVYSLTPQQVMRPSRIKGWHKAVRFTLIEGLVSDARPGTLFFRLAIGDARWVSDGGRPQKKENKIDPNQSILFGEEI